mgnify:CR=1 FL=1
MRKRKTKKNMGTPAKETENQTKFNRASSEKGSSLVHGECYSTNSAICHGYRNGEVGCNKTKSARFKLDANEA